MVERVRKASIFLFGFFSLFQLPYYRGIRLIDILVFATLLLIFCLQRFSLSKKSFDFLMLSMGYFIFSLIGGLVSTNESTFLVSAIVTARLFFSLLAFLLISGCHPKSYEIFFLGFRMSATLSCCWILIDHLCYLRLGVSINEIVFKSWGTTGVGNALTHRFLLGNTLILRSSAFGWDPGGAAPGLIVAMLSAIQFRKYALALIFLLGAFATVSRTGILTLSIIFGVLFLARSKVLHFSIRSRLLSSLIVLVCILPAIIVPWSAAFVADAGTKRHILYPGAFFRLLENGSWYEILLGFGKRGTGFFANLHFPEVIETQFWFLSGQNMESDYANYYVSGGILGTLVIATLLVRYALINSGIFEKLIILAVILFSVGYSFETTWVLIVLSAVSTRQHKLENVRLFSPRKLSEV